MKISNRFRKSYEFYLKNIDVLNFSGKPIQEITEDVSGLSAMECFFFFDSTGKIKPCREPDLFQRLLTCKASVNLHIKMWAMSLRMGLTDEEELLEMLHDEFSAPPWVLKSIVAQARRVS